MIRAKTPFAVKHLHHRPRAAGAIDGTAGTVDNCGSAGRGGLQYRRSENNLSTMSSDLWQRGCERLAAEMPEQQYNTWIRPLPVADIADGGDDGAVVQVRARKL